MAVKNNKTQHKCKEFILNLRKIILIDDDDVTLYLNRLLIEDTELAQEVVCINDSWQALKYVLANYHKKEDPKEGDADLIFLDINMPGMTGFELLQDMEVLNINRSRIFIVMLSTSFNEKDKDKAASFGDKLSGYIVKPLQKGAVEEVLRKIQIDS